MKTLRMAAMALMLLGASAAHAQNGPILGSGQKVYELLSRTNEVVIHMPGYEYQYVGDWLGGMKLEDDNTLSFTRGRVKHTFDLRKVTFIQDEGRFIKVWFL